VTQVGPKTGLLRQVEKIEVSREPEKNDLNQIEDKKPVKTSRCKIQIQKLCHAQRSQPEEKEDIDHPLDVVGCMEHVVIRRQRLR